MNPCIKTGAVVFLEPTGQYARCDAFLTGSCYYFRITTASLTWESQDVLHFQIEDWVNWFDSHAPISTMMCRDSDVKDYMPGVSLDDH